MAVQCVVKKGDPPVALAWLHDGAPAGGTPGVTVAPLGQFVSALIIDAVAPHHAGNYTCEARSPAGTATHTSPLHVHGTYGIASPRLCLTPPLLPPPLQCRRL